MTDVVLNAEVGVVGSILISPQALPIVRAVITESAFQTEVGGAIFAAACRLHDANEAVDPITIKREAESHGYEISTEYLMEAMAVTPTAENAEAYAHIMRESELKRRIVSASEETITKIQMGESPKDACVFLQSALEDAVAQEKADSLISPTDAMIGFMDYRNAVQDGVDAYLRTGYRALDELLGGGFVKEGLYILAARPGVGKTTLGLQIADRIASAGKSTLFVSLEMSINQLSAKRIAVDTNLHSNVILTGLLNDDEFDKVCESANRLSQRPMSFNKSSGTTVSDVGFIAKQMKSCDFIVIDYLGIMQHEKGASLYESVTKTSNALKRLARTLGIPILCLAQLNRNSADKPKMSDLRDSGAIEQDADGILLLHRTNPAETDRYAPAELDCYVAKNRHGATGATRFNMYLQSGRIVQVDR